MVDLQQVQMELNGARRARLAVETAEHEIEALVLDMQNSEWHRLALVDALRRGQVAAAALMRQRQDRESPRAVGRSQR